MNHIVERCLRILEDVIKRLCGGEVRNNHKVHFTLPVRMGFDDIIRLLLRSYCRGDIVSPLWVN